MGIIKPNDPVPYLFSYQRTKRALIINLLYEEGDIMNSVCVIQDNKSCLRRSLDRVNITKLLEKNQCILPENKIYEANYIIIITCGFNEVARDDGIKLIKKARYYVDESHILVMGCLPGVIPEYFLNSTMKFVRPADYYKLPHLIKEMGLIIEDDKKAVCHQMNSGSTRLRQNDISLPDNSYYLNVSKGCLGNCSYCEIKKAVGQLVSRSLLELIQEVKSAISNGAKSIYLGADDLGAWGLDIGYSLPVLLTNIIHVFEEIEQAQHLEQGYFFIDLRNVIHAQWFVKYYSELFELMKIYKDRFPYISLAMQSGSTEILSRYHRYNNVSAILKVIRSFYSVNTSLYGFGHMIAGAPYESHKDITATIEFIQKSPIQFWTCFKYSMKEKGNNEEIEKCNYNWHYFVDIISKSTFKVKIEKGKIYVAKKLCEKCVFINFNENEGV